MAEHMDEDVHVEELKGRLAEARRSADEQALGRARAEQAAVAFPRIVAVCEALRAEREALRAQLTEAKAEAEQACRAAATAAAEAARTSADLEAARLRAQLAEADAAQAHAMYGAAFSSRSWRWTRPLRGEIALPRPKRRPRALTAPYRTTVTATVVHQAALPGAADSDAPGPSPPRTAVAAHVFYADLWDDLRAQLGNLLIPFDLHVTLTEGVSDHLAQTVRHHFPAASVLVTPNRGRDMAPFARQLQAGLLDDYDAVLKLHTKRSRHRVDGETWRRSLWHGLLPDADAAEHFARLVAGHPEVGAILPAGNRRGAESIGSNSERTAELLARIGLEFVAEELSFPAGSMYWLDGSVVALLQALALDPLADFEDEQGQTDGTTAHALERVVGVLLARQGQLVLDSEQAMATAVTPEWAAGVLRPRVLAFYLPQYHRDAANDAFWGEGFTDWVKVAAARPWHRLQRFPRRPSAELGEYDLSSTDVLRSQAHLARRFGVDGFLVYHYWFSGRRALERPMDELLRDPSVDFPYALVWANENWTRTWDGLEDEVLLHQHYEPGWEAGLVASVEAHLRDPRYLTVDGRPLMVLFKPGLIPDLPQAVGRLREAARAAGLGELHLAGVLHDRHVDGALDAGSVLDSWVEFPPLSGPEPQELTEQSSVERGRVYSYRGLVDQKHARPYVSGRPVHPGVMPAWDNTPRRTTGASAFSDANPADFRRWLLAARKRAATTSAPTELLVCVNAWNEWAETAYLEPDEQIGSAHLAAVRSVFGPSVAAVRHGVTAS